MGEKSWDLEISHHGKGRYVPILLAFWPLDADRFSNLLILLSSLEHRLALLALLTLHV